MNDFCSVQKTIGKIKTIPRIRLYLEEECKKRTPIKHSDMAKKTILSGRLSPYHARRSLMSSNKLKRSGGFNISSFASALGRKQMIETRFFRLFELRLCTAFHRRFVLIGRETTWKSRVHHSPSRCTAASHSSSKQPLTYSCLYEY